jgi:hypothetical protein
MARLVKDCLRKMGNIQMNFVGEAHYLAREGRGAGMHKYQIYIGGASKQR